MKKNAMPAGRQGFAPLIIILLIAILGVVGYLLFKNTRLSSTAVSQGIVQSTPTSKPLFVPTNAKITKINNKLGLYNNIDYSFSFEFPWAEGVRLDETSTRIEYPFPLTGATGYSPDISVIYLANPQKLSLIDLMKNEYNSDSWFKNNNISFQEAYKNYQKYIPVDNNLQVYIDRTAPGRDTNQDLYVLSSNGKYALHITCFLQTPDVNHILSTLKFSN